MTVDREALIQAISDVSKDAYGMRPRIDWDQLRDSELQDTLTAACEALTDTMQRECLEHLFCQRKWEERLASLLKIGAGDLRTALLWDFEASSIDEGDVGFYCFEHGLAYELEGRIQSILNG